jgi:hypothetical protein
MESRHFTYVHRGPTEMVVDRVASTSFIAALEPLERDRLLDEVRHLLAAHVMTRGAAFLDLPYRTVTFVTSRLA